MWQRFMYNVFCKYLRQQIIAGHTDEVMLEVVRASKEIWTEDNVFTHKSELEKHLINALAYEHQIIL